LETRDEVVDGTIGGPRNDPSIHQSIGGRDSRGYPKQQ